MPDVAPSHPVYVCTHHRCGTVLMRNIFTRYTKFAPHTFFKGDPAAAPDGCDIVQDAHSRSPLALAGEGIHLVRDPFDLLVSHVRYHEKTMSPTEPPNAERMADGRTYKEHLRALPDLTAKAMFELDHVCGRTLRTMLAFDYDNPRFLNLPLDVFLEPEPAGRAAEAIAARFALFGRHAEILKGAVLHFVSKAEHIKQSHGTRQPGAAPAKSLLSKEVAERLYAEFPRAAEVEARLAAWTTPESAQWS